MTEPELLTLIASHAPALRAAGVLTLSMPSLSVTLAPADPEPASGPRRVELEPSSALHDPATYGGPVPGFDLSELRSSDGSGE